MAENRPKRRSINTAKRPADTQPGGAAVDKHDVGSRAWFEALGKANGANSKHMAEEERQGLTDLCLHTTIEARHALGIKFAAFQAEHITGVRPQDKDPKQWVGDHQPRK